MVDIRLRFERLARKGWRNPLTDAESILDKYNIALQDREDSENLAQYIKKAAQAVAKQQQQRRRRKWETLIHYARVLRVEKSKVTFPALKNIALEDWVYKITHAAMEEQEHGLGSNTLARRPYKFGCASEENSYHVVSACPSAETTASPRHSGHNDIDSSTKRGHRTTEIWQSIHHERVRDK